jgi:hypothetical protein
VCPSKKKSNFHCNFGFSSWLLSFTAWRV